MSESSSFFSPLANRTYRAIWVATVIGYFGTVVQMVAAAWMMTTLTSSASMVALVQASK